MTTIGIPEWIRRTPKHEWLLVIFRIGGVVILIFEIGIAVSLLVYAFVFSCFYLAILAVSVVILAFIILRGSWNLKCWVIPLLFFTFLFGLFSRFISGDGVNIFQMEGGNDVVLISGILLLIGYFYRKEFSGNYLNIFNSGGFIVTLIALGVAIYYPISFGGIAVSQAQVDNYIDYQLENLLKDVKFKNSIENALKSRGRSLEDVKIILKQFPKFRQMIRIILQQKSANY